MKQITIDSFLFMANKLQELRKQLCHKHQDAIEKRNDPSDKTKGRF